MDINDNLLVFNRFPLIFMKFSLMFINFFLFSTNFLYIYLSFNSSPLIFYTFTLTSFDFLFDIKEHQLFPLVLLLLSLDFPTENQWKQMKISRFAIDFLLFSSEVSSAVCFFEQTKQRPDSSEFSCFSEF